MKNYARIFTFALMVQSAIASASSQQWIEISRRDIYDADRANARESLTANVHAFGDFNGDGIRDRAAIYRDANRQRYAVFACLSQNQGQCRNQFVSQGPYKDVLNLGVMVLRATKSECSSIAAGSKADCVGVFTFESSGALNRWTGASFAVAYQGD